MAHAAPASGRAVPVVVGAAVASALVAGAAFGGLGFVLAAVASLQIAAAGGIVVLAAPPAPRQSVLLALVVAGTADILLLRDGDRLGDLVAVVSLAFVAAVLLELVRRNRRDVTTSLAATMSAVMLMVLVAHLLALYRLERGERLLLVGYVCVTVGLLTGWLVGRVTSTPAAVIATALAGAAAGAALGLAADPLQAATGAAQGGAAALAAGVATAAFAAAVGEVAPRQRDLARPLGAVLPGVVAAPVAYALSLLVVG